MPGSQRSFKNSSPRTSSRRDDYMDNNYDADDEVDGETSQRVVEDDSITDKDSGDLVEDYLSPEELIAASIDFTLLNMPLAADLDFMLPNMPAPAGAVENMQVEDAQPAGSESDQNSVNAVRGEVIGRSPLFICPSCSGCVVS